MIKIGMGVIGDRVVEDEQPEGKKQKADQIRDGRAKHIDQRTRLRLRSSSAFAFDDVTNKVLEDGAVLPVIVVRFSRQGVAREADVVFLFELERRAFVL